jgi:hypothetical protein
MPRCSVDRCEAESKRRTTPSATNGVTVIQLANGQVDSLDLVDYLEGMRRELDVRTLERLGRALKNDRTWDL